MTPAQREVRAWYLYDWANSAFFTTVAALFLGPYLTSLAKAAAGSDGLVHPFGIPIDPRSFWSYAVSVAVSAQVLVLPIVGAIADYGRRKRQALAATAFVGSVATIAMYFLQGHAYLWGGLLFVISNTSFGASIVVYNSFLPEIAVPEDRDRVSATGWGIGYMGGGLLLALNLALYLGAERIGISEALAVRISLCSAGVWAALFTIPVVSILRDRGESRDIPAGETMVGVAFRQVAHTLRDMRKYPETLLFLSAYLLYNDAIQTVLAVTTQFANDELKIPIPQVTMAYLMSQFIGIFGATGFGKVSGWIGSKNAILLCLAVWIGVLIAIYASVRTTPDFFWAVGAASVVVGGSQALSRSLFAQLIPKGKEAESFSIYEISDKGTCWLGPLVFGLALQLTHSYRAAILSLIAFFFLGGALLTRVNVRRGLESVCSEE